MKRDASYVPGRPGIYTFQYQYVIKSARYRFREEKLETSQLINKVRYKSISLCILAFQLGGLMIMIIAAMFGGMLLLHYKATNQVYSVAMHEVEYK